jgi:hypothetical protein
MEIDRRAFMAFLTVAPIGAALAKEEVLTFRGMRILADQARRSPQVFFVHPYQKAIYEALVRGERLTLNVPPRHGKSLLSTYAHL